MDILRFGWHLSPALRANRLERVLRASAHDPYYRLRLSKPAASQDLDQAPWTDPADWKRNRTLCRLPDVVEHPLRRGLLAAEPDANGFYTAFAASPGRLLELARLRRGVRPRAEYAVLSLERPGETGLDEAGRDVLWDAFQAPVYRLLLGFDGTLLGHECEALTGLHAAPDAVFETRRGRLYVTSLADLRHPTLRLATGWSGLLDPTPCDCARSGPRLAVSCARRVELSNAAD